MGWVYVDDQPAAVQQRGGGCVTVGLWGLLAVVVSIMVWVIWQDLGIHVAITDGPPSIIVPTAAIERRAISAPAPLYSVPDRATAAPPAASVEIAPAAPVVPAPGTFETLPAPEPIAPDTFTEPAPVIDVAPAVEQWETPGGGMATQPEEWTYVPLDSPEAAGLGLPRPVDAAAYQAWQNGTYEAPQRESGEAVRTPGGGMLLPGE